MSYRIAIKRAVLAVSFVLLPLFVGGCSVLASQDPGSLSRVWNSINSDHKPYASRGRSRGDSYSDYYGSMSR